MSAVAENDIVAVVVARLAAVGVTAFELDEARAHSIDTLPDNYAEVHLAFESNGATLLDGHSDLDGYVLALRACGKTVANTRETRRRIRSAIYAIPLVVGGVTSTPPQTQPGEMADQDGDGYWSALDEYTFTFD